MNKILPYQKKTKTNENDLRVGGSMGGLVVKWVWGSWSALPNKQNNDTPNK